MSDNAFAYVMTQENHLTSPEQIFKFVIEHKIQAPTGSPNSAAGASFRTLVKRPGDWLWCDEGAIVVAVMVGQLEYETRLVDLVSTLDGVSHHTVLQIQQENNWVTYDFTGRQYNVPIDKTVDYPSAPIYRPYPNWQQKLLLNNYFLRELAQMIRPWLK
jgi:hypothetical protein